MNRKSKSNSRRRSRSLVGFASKGLCETIPKSLDSAERLLMLIELSFQYALSTVQKEILPSNFDLSMFRQQGSETWEKIRKSIEERNLVQLAVAENGIASTSFTSENIEEYHKTVKVLEMESRKWREQLSNFRESLKRKIDSPYIIDASIWEDKKQLPEYSGILQASSSIQEDLSKQITCLSQCQTAYKSCLQLNKDINRTLVMRCQKYYGQNKRPPPSPRNVIRKMMSTKRNVSPYAYVK